jgi:membrane associated rhomboid family serine protease
MRRRFAGHDPVGDHPVLTIAASGSAFAAIIAAGGGPIAANLGAAVTGLVLAWKRHREHA